MRRLHVLLTHGEAVRRSRKLHFNYSVGSGLCQPSLSSPFTCSRYSRPGWGKFKGFGKESPDTPVSRARGAALTQSGQKGCRVVGGRTARGAMTAFAAAPRTSQTRTDCAQGIREGGGRGRSRLHPVRPLRKVLSSTAGCSRRPARRTMAPYVGGLCALVARALREGVYAAGAVVTILSMMHTSAGVPRRVAIRKTPQ